MCQLGSSESFWPDIAPKKGAVKQESFTISDIESIVFDLAFHEKLKESKLQKNVLNKKGYEDIPAILSRNCADHS